VADVSLSVDGTVSTGSITVANVAPSLFSANSSGSGVAAAYLIRVRSGVQSIEPILTFSSSSSASSRSRSTSVRRRIRLFLIFFGTGIRGSIYPWCHHRQGSGVST
jgi:hypothetical protein